MADNAKQSDIKDVHPGLAPLPPIPEYLATTTSTKQDKLTEYKESLRVVPASRKPDMMRAIVEAMLSGKEVLNLDSFMDPGPIENIEIEAPPINKSHAAAPGFRPLPTFIPPPDYKPLHHAPAAAPLATVDTVKKRNIIRE